MIERYTVYDLETLANCFTAYFKDWETGKEKYFVICPWRNDYFEFMQFLRKLKDNDYVLVGYNCNAFDAQILEHMIENFQSMRFWDGNSIARDIYEKSQWVIGLPDEEKWMHLIPEWKFNIPHIDIYKQKHYDGKQRRCSLKWLEFTMRLPNIESMPIHHSTELETEEQVDEVVGYNGTDTCATFDLFKLNKFETDLRLSLSEKFDLRLVNASEPRMARDIFGKFMSEAMHIRYRDLKELRTYRGQLCPKDFIFDYVKFRDPILKGIKSFYENLEFNPYNFEENNYGLEDVEKVFKFANIQDAVVGLGGIHACMQPGVVTATKKWLIRDIDVTSFYPNLGIENGLYPQHLSKTFCKIYKELFDMRQKIDKKDPENLVYKIILNSTYGLSKEPNNYLHDPKYTFAITINGQLLLLMFCELIKMKVKDVMFYQINTDGVTIGYPDDQEKVVDECMKLWSDYTDLKLEQKFYSKMVIMDVNNYLAVDTKGGIKRKGLFAYSLKPEDKELEYHKNPSNLVIPKALEAYFVNNVPIKDYILSVNDIFDFCAGVKVKKDFDLVEHTFNRETNRIEKEIIKQTVVRYYVSKEYKSLKKHYKPGTKMTTRKAAKNGKPKSTPTGIVEIKKGWNTKYFNRYVKKPMDEYKIDYDYYIQSCRDIIADIEPHGKNLKLF